MSCGVVERWEHHRSGVYSLCTVNDDCILSGDGAGLMHCYSGKYINMFLFVNIQIHICIYIYLYIYVYIFMFTHIYTYKNIQKKLCTALTSSRGLKYGLGCSQQGAVRSISHIGE
jgi:hypothetical protein